MLKHIGRHGDRKVVVLFRQVPDEPHMCLVSYSDLLPRIIHDTIMSSVESAPGQQANNFADTLHRVLMADGRNVLEVLHKEGFIKKVQTSQIIMTPTTSSQCRLDELNKIIDEMATGEDAVKRLAEMDNSKGLQTKKSNVTPRNVGDPVTKESAPVPLMSSESGVLSNEDIARHQLSQATRMRAEASMLLAEATRLENESAKLSPQVKSKAQKQKTSVSEPVKVKTVAKKVPSTNVTSAKQKAKKTSI